MLDGIYQSVIIYFFTSYAYASVSARSDGYDVGMFEFSTTMAVASVMIVNAFNGLNTRAWTVWVWFSVSIGVVLVWLYTAIYSVIKPTTFYTKAYGNTHFLFRSAYFWFCIPLVFFLALLPRVLAKQLRLMERPNDIDIMRAIRKEHPNLDIANDPQLGGRFKDGNEQFVSPRGSMETDRQSMRPRPSMQSNHFTNHSIGSRVDMSTGLRSTGNRGFDFSAEEGGVAIRRMQSNISERQRSRIDVSNDGTKRKSLHFPGLRRSTWGKKPVTP